MINMLDWYGIWNWIVANFGSLLVFIAGLIASMPIWAIVMIAGCLGVEGIRRMVKVPMLLHHVRVIKQAEIEHRIGIIEKPNWECKHMRNKGLKIGDSIYHPLQSSPGGLWLHIASNKDDVQCPVYLVTDLQKLIHNSVEFHSREHRNEAVDEIVWGVIFLALGSAVIIIYSMLN